MTPVLAKIIDTGLVLTKDGRETRPVHSGISQHEGEFIQDLIAKYRPQQSLEVGCAYGISSLFICEALGKVSASKHIIIDPFQFGKDHRGPDPGYEGIGYCNLERAGLAHLVDFRAELSYQCLPQIEKSGHRIDFAFIDGMHTFDYAMIDFFYVDKMLNVGGIVIFDDLSYHSIRKLCRYIVRNLPYEAAGPRPAAVPTSWRRKVLSRDSRLRNLIRDEIVIPDPSIGIPSEHFMALRKTAEDTIGDGPEFFRRWNDHSRF